MRKFFSEHPVTSILLTSCLTVFVLVFGSIFLFVVTLTKGIEFISKNIDTTNTIETSKTSYTYYWGNKASTNKILMIPITGIILTDNLGNNNSFGNLFSEGTYGYQIKDILLEASKDSSIQGIILYMDSPGGTIAGAKAIYDGLEYYKEKTGNPVVAYVSGLAASGGYLSILPCDKIYADKGSLVGSIGVIMGPFKYFNKVLSESSIGGGVTTENGIDSFYITAGKSKDLGNPYKQMTEEEKQALQDNIDSEYEWFVSVVNTKRGINVETIKTTIGAMIYDGSKAMKLQLIDEIASKDKVFEQMAKNKNYDIENVQIVTIKKNDFFSRLMELSSSAKTNIQNAQIRQLDNEMLFLYGTPEQYLK